MELPEVQSTSNEHLENIFSTILQFIKTLILKICTLLKTLHIFVNLRLVI